MYADKNTGPGGFASVGPAPGVLESELNGLAGSIGMLSDSITTLEVKMRSVLRPEPPQPAPLPAQGSQTAVAQFAPSPMVLQVQIHRGNVDALTALVDRLRERLEAQAMKRSGPLSRKTPLRRTKAGGPSWEREEKPRAAAAVPTVRSLHRGTYEGSTSGVAVQKAGMVQHAGYMTAVRDLCLCVRCGRGLTRAVFCHRDMGKGVGIKTDVREGWAGCDDCHYLVGTSGTLPKPVRRAVELLLAAITRGLVLEMGGWPARLPLWHDGKAGGTA